HLCGTHSRQNTYSAESLRPNGLKDYIRTFDPCTFGKRRAVMVACKLEQHTTHQTCSKEFSTPPSSSLMWSTPEHTPRQLVCAPKTGRIPCTRNPALVSASPRLLRVNSEQCS